MREPILKAVAQPPQLFWAPMLPATANLAVQLPITFICIALFDLNPIVIASSTVIVHLGLVLLGMRDPHLSTMLQASGPHLRKTRNAFPVKGNKFVA